MQAFTHFRDVVADVAKNALCALVDLEEHASQFLRTRNTTPKILTEDAMNEAHCTLIVRTSFFHH